MNNWTALTLPRNENWIPLKPLPGEGGGEGGGGGGGGKGAYAAVQTTVIAAYDRLNKTESPIFILLRFLLDLFFLGTIVQ